MVSVFIGRILFCLWLNQVFGYIPLILNIKLSSDHLLGKFSGGDLHRCAETCVFKTDCLSASFSRDTKDCEMYKMSSIDFAEEDIVQQDKTVLFEISHWPRARTGACWDKPCSEKMMCVQYGETYRCQTDDEVGCAPFVIPEHGMIVDSNGYPINSTRLMYSAWTTILGKCRPPHVTSLISPNEYWIIHCKGNYEWSWNYTCYTTEELCTYKIIQEFYPSRVTISVTSAIFGWVGPDVFLNATNGWITSINNDQQYLKLEFNGTNWLGGLITKGGVDGNWVKFYNVSYSIDCTDYDFLLEPGFEIERNFPGNMDATSSVTNTFEMPIKAKCLRIHPTDYQGGISMRLEVLACKEYY